MSQDHELYCWDCSRIDDAVEAEGRVFISILDKLIRMCKIIQIKSCCLSGASDAICFFCMICPGIPLSKWESIPIQQGVSVLLVMLPLFVQFDSVGDT